MPTRTATALRLFTRDGGVGWRFEREVSVGMVGINVPIPVPVAWHSFGGVEGVALRRCPYLRPRGHPLRYRRKVVTFGGPNRPPA